MSDTHTGIAFLTGSDSDAHGFDEPYDTRAGPGNKIRPTMRIEDMFIAFTMFRGRTGHSAVRSQSGVDKGHSEVTA